MRSSALLFALVTVLGVPSVALADDARKLPMPEVLVSAGVRVMGIPSKGFDPYATNDVLLQSSFSAGLAFIRTKTLSLSASFEWDAGGKSATTRSQEMDLFVHRLAIPIELRWTPTERFGLFLKAAPGGNRILISTDVQTRARTWSFGADATGGAALMFGKAKHARFWLTAEVGYAFACAAAIKLTTQPGEDDPPRHYGSTALPNLQLGGGLGRLGVTVAF